MRGRIASPLRFVLGAAFVGLFFCHTAGAQVIANVTVDENGNGTGTLGSGFLAPDPGPGGLTSALTYDLLFAAPPVDDVFSIAAFVTPGDVVLLEQGVVSDVIRFNSFFDGGIDILAFDGSPFTLVFYSDSLDGSDALADTGLPTAFYTNVVRIEEIGPEGNNGVFYTPTEGQPGYIEFGGIDGPAGVTGFTYHFVSDSVPEPSSTALLLLGLAVLVVGMVRGRHTRACA